VLKLQELLSLLSLCKHLELAIALRGDIRPIYTSEVHAVRDWNSRRWLCVGMSKGRLAVSNHVSRDRSRSRNVDSDLL
jgi:hypothetical protein